MNETRKSDGIIKKLIKAVEDHTIKQSLLSGYHNYERKEFSAILYAVNLSSWEYKF